MGDGDAPPALAYEIAVPLIAANGALDAYTFLAHNGVFATAQTGNVVLFAIGLVRPAVAAPLPHLWPILAFVAGIAVARSLNNPKAPEEQRRSRRWVLAVRRGCRPWRCDDDAPRRPRCLRPGRAHRSRLGMDRQPRSRTPPPNGSADHTLSHRGCRVALEGPGSALASRPAAATNHAPAWPRVITRDR